jgi:hypothetical protein
VALASAGAVVGSLATGIVAATVAVADSNGSVIKYTSQPAVAGLVTHYTVSHGQRGEDSSGSAGDSRQLPRLNKNGKVANTPGSDPAAAPQSDNTSSDSQGSSADQGGNNTKASFIGQSSSATTCSYFGPGCNPPDMGLAASTDFVLQGVNTQFEVLDTSGHVQPGWPVSAQAFFGVPNTTKTDGTPCDVAHKSQPFLSDPRALYDPIDHRFWAAMLQAENAPSLGLPMDCPFKSVYYIAVSKTSDPRGDWNVYEFNMSQDGQFAADFTQIGINRDAIYFSSNMFGPFDLVHFGFYAEVFEANKAKMERGQGGFTADGFFNMRASGPGITSATGPFLADTLQPALNIDNSGGSGEVFADTLDGPDPVTGHFCSSAADSCSGIAIWRMTNPIGHDRGGPAPVLTATTVPSKPYAFSPPADQPSCNRCVDALDLRFTATPIVRGGVLYGAFETGLNNGTHIVPSIEWAQIGLSGSEDNSTQTGYYSLSGDAAVSFPALMPDGHGNVVMLFEHMSNTVFPETRYIVKSAGGQFHGTGTLIKAGEDSYRPQLCGTAQPPPLPPTFVCRWGDFSASSFDGAGGIWLAGEYANALNLGAPQNGRNWGTWIASVNAGGSGD